MHQTVDEPSLIHISCLALVPLGGFTATTMPPKTKDKGVRRLSGGHTLAMLPPGVDPARGIFGPPAKTHQPAGAASEVSPQEHANAHARNVDPSASSPSPGTTCARGSGAQCKAPSLVSSSALAGTGCQVKARSPVASSGMGPSEGPADAMNKFPPV